jgi:hypothetical protein
VRSSGYEAATFEDLEQAREITQQMRAREELRPLEWQVRIRDPLGRWPRRAVYKTVRARIHVPSLKIAQEIPVWATAMVYSSMVPVEYLSPFKSMPRSKEEEWLAASTKPFVRGK